MTNQIDDDHFDDDDIDSKPWPQDNDGFDDMDGDFDDKAFDDFNNAPDGQNDLAAPRKKSPLLIMGGAVLAIALIGGYFAKDILTGANTMQPAPEMAQNTPPDPFMMNNNAMTPPGINTDTAIPVDTGAPPAVDFNAYDAATAGEMIGDDAFVPDTTASNAEMPGYAGALPGSAEDPFGNVAAGNVDDNVLDAMAPPNTGDFAVQEENSITIPFSNESAPDAVAATVIAVEDIPLENLTAQQDDTAGDAATNDTINEAIADAFAPVSRDMGMAGGLNGGNTGNPAQAVAPDAPQESLAALKQQVEILTTERKVLEMTITQLQADLQRLKDSSAAVNKNSPVAGAVSSADTAEKPAVAGYAPVNPPPPSAKPALARPQSRPFVASATWILRAASAQEAYISKRGEDELIHVKTGDTIPGMGTVKTIAHTPRGWQVLTDSGVIGQ